MSAQAIQLIFGALNLYCAFFTSLFMLPMIFGKVSMNSGYGVKIPGAFDSEEKWHKINKYAAKVFLLIYCFPVAMSGLVLLLLPQVRFYFLFLCFFLPHLLLGISFKVVVKYSNSKF